MSNSKGSLAALASGPAELLKLSGESLAAVEATSAGLISASLQSVPRASRFWQGGVNIYSAKAFQALLPRELFSQLGDVKTNYSSAANYIRSKEVFTSVLAKHFRKQFQVDWVVAESGAAEGSALPRRLRDAGAFSAVTIAGPDGLEVSRIYKAVPEASREENMWAFAGFALNLLEECIAKREAGKGSAKSKL